MKTTTLPSKPAPPISGYKAPAVHKALELLRKVAEAQNGVRLVELAEQLGYSKGTTHGLVHALLRESALIQDEETKGFLLGPLIANLAFTDWNYIKVNERAQPILEEVRDQVSATVFLGMRIRTQVMITAKADALEALKITAPVGATIPLFAGAAGLVLLAQETDENVARLVAKQGLPRFTANSITRLDRYLSSLQIVRNQGFAIDDEAYLSGIRAVAVALQNRRGLPMALWIVGIASNMQTEKLQYVADIGRVAAKKLRAQIQLLRNADAV